MSTIRSFCFNNSPLSTLTKQIQHYEHGKVDVEASLLLQYLTVPYPHVHLTFCWVAASKHGDPAHQTVGAQTRRCLNFDLVFERWVQTNIQTACCHNSGNYQNYVPLAGEAYKEHIHCSTDDPNVQSYNQVKTQLFWHFVTNQSASDCT